MYPRRSGPCVFSNKSFCCPQVVNLMKPIVAASSHVLGSKDVDKGENPSATGLYLPCFLQLRRCFATILKPIIIPLLHRDGAHFGRADERICPAALRRLPSSCDLTSCRAAGQTRRGRVHLIAHTHPSTLCETS